MCICIAKKYAKRSVQRLSRFVRVHRRTPVAPCKCDITMYRRQDDDAYHADQDADADDGDLGTQFYFTKAASFT